ncbi:hypothetical protein ACQHIV_28865 [Kribbella sp. GL6]|uniref:hypothetical protein n=1 Tax=Kribbella sp. GL6 TaxID=3419765 RepID=UPI003D002344
MGLVYVTGSSGVGKTAVGDELRRRGYVVYDVDRDRLARWFDAGGAEVAMPAERDDAWFADHTYRVPPETLRARARRNCNVSFAGTKMSTPTTRGTAPCWSMRVVPYVRSPIVSSAY